MGYAYKTSVPVDRSQCEIKKILTKYAAKSFAYGETDASCVVMFEMASRRIKFVLPMMTKESCNKNDSVPSDKEIDQEARRRWRCLVLCIKAKLESVESGITTFEQEFLAHIVLPNGQTVGSTIMPQIESSYKNGEMPPLLGYHQ